MGRRHALRLIGMQENVVEALLPLLDDSSWVVQGETAQTLGDIGALEALLPLGKLLDIDHTYVRASATYALVKLAVTSDTPGIQELLRSSSERISTLSEFVIQVVASSNQRDFIQMSLNKDVSSFVKEAAMMLLARANDIQAASAIADLFNDSSPSVRAVAVGAIGRLHAYEYIPQICQLMLTDSDAFVRYNAVNALEWLYARDTFLKLLQATEDKDPLVRSIVVRTFGRLRITEARPILKQYAKKDSDSRVRFQAIRALGFVGNSEDINFLETIVNIETNKEVLESIHNAIQDISRGEIGLGL